MAQNRLKINAKFSKSTRNVSRDFTWILILGFNKEFSVYQNLKDTEYIDLFFSK